MSNRKDQNPTDNRIRLTWCGTASLLLEKDGCVLALDPFPGIPAGMLTGKPEKLFLRLRVFLPLLWKARAVFITHGHLDHIGYLPVLFGKRSIDANPDLKIYATDTPCRTLLQDGLSYRVLRRIQPGDSVREGAFRIRAYRSRHCRFDLPLILHTLSRPGFLKNPLQALWLLFMNFRYPENGETLFYEITDGTVRIQVCGSMNLDPSVRYPTGADYLILPYQGKSDPCPAALKLIRRLAPRQVLLDHWDNTFPPLSSHVKTEKICRASLQVLHIPCRPLMRFRKTALPPLS